MFHILVENSTPNHLVGGPWTSVRPESHSDVEPSILECGLRGGQVREALSHSDVRQLINSKRFKFEQACRACLKKLRGRYGQIEN